MDQHHEAPGDVPRELVAVVRRAERNAREGGGPFAAVVVLADGSRFTGTNQVVASHDPSAHAEVMAIREACRASGAATLEGAVLYASCEPCPMCLGVALWARLERVYHAADRHDAARSGFDDDAFHRYFSDPAERARLPVVQQRIATAAAPFAAWDANPQAAAY